MWTISAERITAPPTSENAPGRPPTASQTHSGPSTHSSTAMREASATGMSRAPAGPPGRVLERPRASDAWVIRSHEAAV